MNTEGLELSLSSKLLDSFSPVFLKMDLLVYSYRESISFELIELEIHYLRAMTYRFFFSSWNHSCDFVQISSSLVQLISGFQLVALWKLSFQLFEIPKYSKWEQKMVSLPKEPFHLLFQAKKKFSHEEVLKILPCSVVSQRSFLFGQWNHMIYFFVEICTPHFHGFWILL